MAQIDPTPGVNTAFYLSHPEVAIDPSVPLPRWELSDVGRDRMRAMLDAAWLQAVQRIVASDETKAQEAAGIVAARLGLPVETDATMGENDRSATGFLPPAAFEATADAFFAQPTQSVRGWERAVDAQQRIVAAVRSALNARPAATTLFVGHGGVGTLLHCAVARLSIDRAHDQARVPGANPRGGNVHAFAADMSASLFGWRPMEQL